MPTITTKPVLFQEAIDYLLHRGKLKLPTSSYADLQKEHHAHAFVIAGAQQEELLTDMYNALMDAHTSGFGLQQFQKDFPNIAKKHGWSYNGTPEWRSKIIYDTNIQQAYNVGRYVQAMALKHVRPYFEYVHTSKDHPRLNHKAWDGIILPADDPWWDTHYPQNGYRCKCRVNSLSKYEAEQKWTAKGNTGVDTAPPIEWEDVTIGKRSGHPQVVRTPKGIDAGFGYNPAKSYLQAYTVPPNTGYDKVFKTKGIISDKLAQIPLNMPMQTTKDMRLKQIDNPLPIINNFLEALGATLEKPNVIEDAIGAPLVISKSLFIKGDEKDGDQFKWLEAPDKIDRLKYIYYMALSILEPDEIWWEWVKDGKENGRWRLKKRYLKSFVIEGTQEYAVSIFEYTKNGWTGATTFMASQNTDEKKLNYFKLQRSGRLVYKKP